MSAHIWKTETSEIIPHPSNIRTMRNIAVAFCSILAIVSSAGSPILTEKTSSQSLIEVDSFTPSVSMQSKEGIYVFSASRNFFKISDSINRLDEIYALSDNWDGEGASSFSSTIIEAAKEFIRSVSVQPDIFPTLRNSIQLEYENDKNEYLEFEVFEDHIKSFFYDHKDRSIVKEVRTEDVNAIVNDFYE